jgi:hypothetical protein
VPPPPNITVGRAIRRITAKQRDLQLMTTSIELVTHTTTHRRIWAVFRGKRIRVENGGHPVASALLQVAQFAKSPLRVVRHGPRMRTVDVQLRLTPATDAISSAQAGS